MLLPQALQAVSPDRLLRLLDEFDHRTRTSAYEREEASVVDALLRYGLVRGTVHQRDHLENGIFLLIVEPSGVTDTGHMLRQKLVDWLSK
jgi:hypothetical protein